MSKWSRLAPWIAGALCAGASLFFGFNQPINDDDIFHLHSLWLVGDGLAPYRDFYEGHPPGLWALLSPLVGLFETPSTLVAAARSVTAIAFGATVVIGCRLIRAGTMASLVLALLAFIILRVCQIWIFRLETLAALLLFAHLLLLSRHLESPGPLWRPALAAALLAFASSFTVRSIPFLALQPVATLWAFRAITRRDVVAYAAGVLLGVAPAAIFLTAHGLWSECYAWCIEFLASDHVLKWEFTLHLRDVVLAVVLLTAAIFIIRERVLSARRGGLLIGYLVFALLLWTVSPFKLNYASAPLLLLGAVAVMSLVPTVFQPTARARRVAAAAIVLGFGIAVFERGHFPPTLLNAKVFRAQSETLDWLRRVAGDEPVVLITPNHPITVRDATAFAETWMYTRLLKAPPIRARLTGLGAKILETRPPAIAANPWLPVTRGMGFWNWLRAHELLSPDEIAAIRELLRASYLRVAIRDLAPDTNEQPFGNEFWIRKDRLRPHRPKIPHDILDISGRLASP